MNKKPNEQDPLRAAAKTPLIHAPKPCPRPAEELLQELQVYQIELEMQNEQLRQSQVDLEESRDRYVDFYDFAPVGYLTLNHEGMIDEINFTGAALLGVVRSKLIHRSFDFFVAMEDRDRWRHHFINVLTRDDTLTCELAFQHDVDPRFDAQLDCQRLRKADKKPVVRIVLTNITKRKRMEADRQANEASMRAILDNSPYMAWLKDTEGRYIAVNKNGSSDFCMG